MSEINITPNVIIAVECNKPNYVIGKGSVDAWTFITYKMGDVECPTFPVQWINAYGNDSLVAASQNIQELATIRMGFNPELYNCLTTTEVKIYRNNETDPFIVHGSVDNIKMLNQMLEFKVKRLVVKPNGN